MRDDVFDRDTRVFGGTVAQQHHAVAGEAVGWIVGALVARLREQPAVEGVPELLEAAARLASDHSRRCAIGIPAFDQHELAGETRPLTVGQAESRALEAI